MTLKADAALIEEAVRAIVAPGQVFELRALQVPTKDGLYRTFSGFFDDPKAFAVAAEKLSDHGAKGVYITPNPVDRTKKTVTNTAAVAQRGGLTKDVDIERVDWLLVDVDPERKAGLSATRAEKGEAGLRERLPPHVPRRGGTRRGFEGNSGHISFFVQLRGGQGRPDGLQPQPHLEGIRDRGAERRGHGRASLAAGPDAESPRSSCTSFKAAAHRAARLHT